MPPSIPTPQRFLSRGAYKAAADRLGCDVEAIIAISVVEGGRRGAFDEDGFPTVLFERHLFHRFTGGQYDSVAPDLSNPTPGGYGLFRDQKHRLARACELNRDAALRATSFGLFQILADNFRSCGATSVQEFVNGMCSGVDYHLTALVYFIGSSPKMTAALKDKRWDTFAYHYNGPAYEKNHYADHLRQAYDMAVQRARTG